MLLRKKADTMDMVSNACKQLHQERHEHLFFILRALTCVDRNDGFRYMISPLEEGIRKKLSGIYAYVSHSFHTEAQLVVAQQLQKDTFKKDIILSTKLPCWSCIHLPILQGCKIRAKQAGILEQEWFYYPVKIYGSRGKIYKEGNEGVRLELIDAPYFGKRETLRIQHVGQQLGLLNGMLGEKGNSGKIKEQTDAMKNRQAKRKNKLLRDRRNARRDMLTNIAESKRDYSLLLEEEGQDYLEEEDQNYLEEEDRTHYSPFSEKDWPTL